MILLHEGETQLGSFKIHWKLEDTEKSDLLYFNFKAFPVKFIRHSDWLELES